MPNSTGGSQQSACRLPTRLARSGSRLLHVQCWAWGRDICCPEGNLLLRYGFKRQRPPEGQSGCSQYTYQLEGELNVRLWGFGVFIGGKTGIYFGRFQFQPRQASLPEAWCPADIQCGQPTFDRNLLTRFTLWASQYEGWVKDQMGMSYRASVLSQWKRSPGDGPLDLSSKWRQLGERLAVTTAGRSRHV